MNNPIQKPFSKVLREFYLDWLNNYLTVKKMAEDNCMSLEDTNKLINLGRKYHYKYTEQLKN